MTCSSSRRGIKLVEVIVIIFVIGLLVCLLIPAVSGVREAARRACCISTLKQIGLTLQLYHDAHRCFPPSMLERPKGHLLTSTSPVPGTDNTNGDGADFGWQTMVLPYMECDDLYQTLDISKGFPYDGSPNHKAVAAVLVAGFNDPDRQGPELRCFSFRGSDWAGAPEYPPKSSAIGNYVALGATHLASLYRTEAQPIGGKSHPNGVLHPGSRTTIKDITDGSTNTVIVCETREQDYAAWIDGTTAAVVGLAEQTGPTFVLRKNQQYYSPAENVCTTLNWGSDDPDEAKVYLPSANHSGSRPWTYGPSSFHPGLVNHLFAGGNVDGISDDIDPALYMHLITRAGEEPVNKFFE